MKPLRTLLTIFVLFIGIVISKDANAIELSKYYKEPLTKTDKAGIIAFNVLQTIDMLQTLEIANNDNYYEKNKILGKHPSEAQVITYFIVRGFAHYEATKMIPVKYSCLLYTSPSPRDKRQSRMPSSA